MSKAPSVVFAGGGTAGHINPMLAIAREIRKIEPTAKITMLGTAPLMRRYDCKFRGLRWF